VTIFRQVDVFVLIHQGLHSTAQHSTAQHSTAQHSTAQHSTAQQQSAAVSLLMGVVGREAHLDKGVVTIFRPSTNLWDHPREPVQYHHNYMGFQQIQCAKAQVHPNVGTVSAQQETAWPSTTGDASWLESAEKQ
jgi:hypothetical protein